MTISHPTHFQEELRTRHQEQWIANFFNASHVDIYDDAAGVIPYDKMESFFRNSLK